MTSTASFNDLPFHVLTASAFSRAHLEDMFKEASGIQTGGKRAFEERLHGRIVATLFFQPSTRTRLSFESAAMRLGARCVSCADGATLRAGSAWNESLADTARVVNAYADLVVLRHGDNGAAAAFARDSVISVVSAGDGTEHPTQALGDLMTLSSEIGYLDGITVMVTGDLHQRCVRSFLLGLSLFRNIRIFLVAHPGTQLDAATQGSLRERGVCIESEHSVESCLRWVDAIYMVGMGDPSIAPQKEHRLNLVALDGCERPPLVLHPLPRGPELPPEIDSHPKAAYFRQASNAVAVRMVLMKHLLSRRRKY